MTVLRSDICEAMLLGAGVVAGFSAYVIPDMRLWFTAWAVILPLAGIALFVYRRL